MPTLKQLPSPTYYPHGATAKNALACLTREHVAATNALVYSLELTNRPDNRLTPDFINYGILEPLDDIEREWRADRKGELEGGPGTGAAALVTFGPSDAHKFYSNGLNLELAVSTPGFFKNTFHFMLGRLLCFPIPTVAAINGHAFAGGIVLALAHDHRVLKDGQGKAGAMMCLNEVDFGAKIPNVRLSLRVSTLIPQGMLSVIKSKVPASSFVPLGLGERFTGSRAVSLGLAHELATGGDQVVRVARERAAALAPKASAGVWGAIKEGLFAEHLPAISLDESLERIDDDVAAAARLGQQPRASKL